MAKRFIFDPKDDSHYPTSDEKELIKTFSQLKDTEEITNFLRDLLTIEEIKEFANRFKMARLLYQGKPYLEVAQKTNSSTTTVSRVAHWLFEGRGGYKTILDRNDNKENQKKKVLKKIKRVLQKPKSLIYDLGK